VRVDVGVDVMWYETQYGMEDMKEAPSADVTHWADHLEQCATRMNVARSEGKRDTDLDSKAAGAVDTLARVDVRLEDALGVVDKVDTCAFVDAPARSVSGPRKEVPTGNVWSCQTSAENVKELGDHQEGVRFRIRSRPAERT
jgi:hypothetical protein